VRLLGLVDVPSALALQKLVVHEVKRQSRLSAAVLICEHPPTITVGLEGSLLDLPVERRELESRLIEVHRVQRNGGTILHQPGQLAVYVVVKLDECGLGENEFRWRLQDAIIETCHDSRVVARRGDDDADVVSGRHGLVCETGIGFDERVTCFGAFLNVSVRLDEARQLGRGLRGERISSLNAERVRPTIMAHVRASLIKHICENVGYPEYHIHTGHPFLRRVQRASAVEGRGGAS
jgi:lipoyl(octanoyl) transferase